MTDFATQCAKKLLWEKLEVVKNSFSSKIWHILDCLPIRNEISS